MIRFRPCLISVLLLGAPAMAQDAVPVPAPMDPALAPAAAIDSPLGSDQVLAGLARDLHTRFNLDGRPAGRSCAIRGRRPAASPRIGAFPLSSIRRVRGASMVVRYRVFADSAALEETTVILHAALWRDAWFAREPMVSGATLEAPQARGAPHR